MSTSALYLVRMDVAHDHETTFNEVYDREHVPNLRSVPGVQRASRYRQPSPTEPRYMAAYEMDSPAIVESQAWKTAGGARPVAGRHPAAHDEPPSDPLPVGQMAVHRVRPDAARPLAELPAVFHAWLSTMAGLSISYAAM